MNHKGFSRATGRAPFTIRQWRVGRRAGLHLAGFLVTVALLAHLGPFGTWASLGVSDRLVFWAVAVGINWLCANIVFSVTLRAFFARGWSPWVGLVLASLLTSVPGTGAVWLVVAAYLDYRPSGIEGLFGLYTQVAVLQLMIGSLVFHFIERSLRQREAAADPPPPGAASERVAPSGRPPDLAGAASGSGEPAAAAPAPALLARLSARSQGDLLHLRMQDHYVEVHTERGMEMLLLRFRDALREVEDVDGMQVHRSHWVARAAVDRVERRAGRVSLRLVNGSRVPVSRSFAPALKARGWI